MIYRDPVWFKKIKIYVWLKSCLDDCLFWLFYISLFDTVTLFDLFYEFVLSVAVWTGEDDELVLVLCSSTAHVVVLIALLATSVTVAHVYCTISLAALLILEDLEVPDSATALWFVFTSVLLEKFKVSLSGLAGGLVHGTFTVECRYVVADSSADWADWLVAKWTSTECLGSVDGADSAWFVLAGGWCAWTLVAGSVARFGFLLVDVEAVAVPGSGSGSLFAALATWSPFAPVTWFCWFASWAWWAWFADCLDLDVSLDVGFTCVFLQMADGSVGDLVGSTDHVFFIECSDVLAAWASTLWVTFLVEFTGGELLGTDNALASGLARSWVGHGEIIIALSAGADNKSSVAAVCAAI